MSKFVLVAGIHRIYQGRGKGSKVITKGAIIESDQPLDQIFKNKFTPYVQPSPAATASNSSPAPEADPKKKSEQAPGSKEAGSGSQTPPPAGPRLKMVKATGRGASGKWNVIDESNGTQINQAPLSREDAAKLVKPEGSISESDG